MMYPMTPAGASSKPAFTRPTLAPVPQVGTMHQADGAPASPHYVPQGFHKGSASGGSLLLLEEDGPNAFEGLSLSTEAERSAETDLLGSPQCVGLAGLPEPRRGTVNSHFRLPPLLVVCLVRHIGKGGEVLATPQPVERVVQDLQSFFSAPILADQIHPHQPAASAPPRGGSRSSSPRPSFAGNTASSSSLLQPPYGGCRVTLQFGKAVDVYSTGGSAILNLFVYAVSESTSRPKLAAQVVKEWREHLIRTDSGESSSMVLLYHKDLVAAAETPGQVNKTKVEAAAALLDEYYNELRNLHLSPQQMSLYHPQETPVRLLERLRTACSLRTAKLVSALEHYQKAKRSMPLDPAIAHYSDSASLGSPSPQNTGSPSKVSAALSSPGGSRPPGSTASTPAAQTGALQASSAGGQFSSPASGSPHGERWNVQLLWRLGFDLALHYLQFGLVFEAQLTFQSLFLEYYNNSDDYRLVDDPRNVERLGRIANLFDPSRSGSEPGRSGYPKALESTAELVDGLLFLAANEMACLSLLSSHNACKARYDTFIQVVQEKFAEDAESGGGARESGAESAPNGSGRGVPPVLQQFFLLQCFLSGLRTFWPQLGLTAPPAKTHTQPQQQQQQPETSASAAPAAVTAGPSHAAPTAAAAAAALTAHLRHADSDDAAKDEPHTVEPITAPLELDTRGSGTAGASVHCATPARAPEPALSPSPSADLKYSMVGLPAGLADRSALEDVDSTAAAWRGISGAAAAAGGLDGDANEHTAAFLADESLPEPLRRLLLRSSSRLAATAASLSGKSVPRSDTPASGTDASSVAPHSPTDPMATELIRRSAVLLRSAFDSGSDTRSESTLFLVRLAQATGFLPQSDVPTPIDEEALDKLSEKEKSVWRSRCVELADLAIHAKDCLAFIASSMGYGSESDGGVTGHSGAAAAFRGTDGSLASASTVTTSSSSSSQSPLHVSPKVAVSPSPKAQAAAAAEHLKLHKIFANVEEFQNVDSCLHFWRVLTIMASVALRVSGQRRREFNLRTKLALTYFTEDPATTMYIISRYLLPLIRDTGWWPLEYFIRHLYVESADHLIEMVRAQESAWSQTQRIAVWRVLFVDDGAYTLYRDCIFFLIHGVGSAIADFAVKDSSSPASPTPVAAPSEHSAAFQMGSLNSQRFYHRTEEELWQTLLKVDSSIAEPVYEELAPGFPMEALVRHPHICVRHLPENSGSSTDPASSHDGENGDDTDSPVNHFHGVLEAEIDKKVEFTFTCECPINVIPSPSGEVSTLRLVLESRRHWEDLSEATHVITLQDSALTYDETAHTLEGRFPFTVCHAGLYRMRSITLRNGSTRLVLYPRRTPSAADLVVSDQVGLDAAEEMDGTPVTLGEAATLSLAQAVSVGADSNALLTENAYCEDPLLYVPEPTSGICLRVVPPTAEHCFADSPTFFTVQVEMEEPLQAPYLHVAGASPTASFAADGAATDGASAVVASNSLDESARQEPTTLHGPLSPTASVRKGLSVSFARGVVQERMKRLGKPLPTKCDDTDCTFEASPGVLSSTFGFSHGPGGSSVVGNISSGHADPAKRNYTPSQPSLLLGSMSGAPLGFDGNAHWKTDPLVVAVMHIAPPKNTGHLARASGSASASAYLGSSRRGTPQTALSTGVSGIGGAQAKSTAGGGGSAYPLAFSNASPAAHRRNPATAAAAAAIATILPLNHSIGSGLATRHAETAERGSWAESSTRVYNAGVTVEYATEPVTPADDASAPQAKQPAEALSARHLHATSSNAFAPLKLPHTLLVPANVSGSGTGEDTLKNTLRDASPTRAPDGLTTPRDNSFSILAPADGSLGHRPGRDAVQLATRPANNFCLDGDQFAAVSSTGGAPTQVRVTILDPQTPPQSLQRSEPGHSQDSEVKQRYGKSEVELPLQPARTTIPFDEVAGLSTLTPPQTIADSATAAEPTTLPMQVTGSVSIFPRKECTFRLSIDDTAAARDAADSLSDADSTSSRLCGLLAPTRRMSVTLPLLPIFLSQAQKTRDVVDSSVSSRDGLERKEDDEKLGAGKPSDHPRITFSCLRGRESCSSSAVLAFPFSQAVAVQYAFRHFQARVYCLVSLTNQLKRTSLWLRGILLQILDRMPTYEVVRVCDSYERFLEREWKPQETLNVLFELALCSRFQPTEAVLHHRLHAKVFYSDWNAVYKKTPEEHRIILRPMSLPATEAGAESVHVGSVTGYPERSPSDNGGGQISATDKENTSPVIGAPQSRLSTMEQIDRSSSGQPTASPTTASREDDAALSAQQRGISTLTVLSKTVSKPASPTSATNTAADDNSTVTASEDDGDRSRDGVGPGLRYNPVSLSILSSTCNTFTGQEAAFRSKHLCLFSAVLYAESPWTTRLGAITNYVPPLHNGSALNSVTAGALGSMVSRTQSTDGNSSFATRSGAGTSEAGGLMVDAMVDQPSDFRFIAGEPVRFCVRLQPNAHNWPEEAGLEEEFLIQLVYDPLQWMVNGKQRERRTLSLMKDETVAFTAVPLLPPTVDPTAAADGSPGKGGKANPTAGGAQASAIRSRAATPAPAANKGDCPAKVRFAGSSVQDEGILQTPTVKVFWANPAKASPDARSSFYARPEWSGDAGDQLQVGQVLVDVVSFRSAVKVYKKVR